MSKEIKSLNALQAMIDEELRVAGFKDVKAGTPYIHAVDDDGANWSLEWMRGTPEDVALAVQEVGPKIEQMRARYTAIK